MRSRVVRPRGPLGSRSPTTPGPVTGSTPKAPRRSCVMLPFHRWREVEVHHVDLGIGVVADAWPDDYIDRELPRALATLPHRLPDAATRRRGDGWPLGPPCRIPRGAGRQRVGRHPDDYGRWHLHPVAGPVGARPSRHRRRRRHGPGRRRAEELLLAAGYVVEAAVGRVTSDRSRAGRRQGSGAGRLQLKHAFSRLNITVDASLLRAEEWPPWVKTSGGPIRRACPATPPSAYCVGATPTMTAVRVPMLPTPHLAAAPTSAGSWRAPGPHRTHPLHADRRQRRGSPHCDVRYYWLERMRVHIPVRTTPDVRFHCGDDDVHMAPGEVGVRHVAPAQGPQSRRGGPDPPGRGHRRVALAVGHGQPARGEGRPGRDRGRARPAVELVTEAVNDATVMGPWELRALAEEVLDSAAVPDAPVVRELAAEVHRYHRQWRAGWAQFGDDPAGWDLLPPVAGRVPGPAGALRRPCPAPQRARRRRSAAPTRRLARAPRPRRDPPGQWQRPDAGPGPGPDSRCEPARSRGEPPRRTGQRPSPARPHLRRANGHAVFIVNPPRSGSSLLFETLAAAPELHTIGGESHEVIEAVPALHPPHAIGRPTGSRPRRHARGRRGPHRAVRGPAAGPGRTGRRAAARSGCSRRPQERPSGAVPRRRLPRRPLRLPLPRPARDPQQHARRLAVGPLRHLSASCPAGAARRGRCCSPRLGELVGRPLVEVVAAPVGHHHHDPARRPEALDADRWCVASYDRLVAEPQAEIDRLCRVRRRRVRPRPARAAPAVPPHAHLPRTPTSGGATPRSCAPSWPG